MTYDNYIGITENANDMYGKILSIPDDLMATYYKNLTNLSKDELDAMRRYVPEWSKNSVLIPFKDKDGNLEYVDFSHLNAYDTITRPIQTIINAVNEGRGDEDADCDG